MTTAELMRLKSDIALKNIRQKVLDQIEEDMLNACENGIRHIYYTKSYLSFTTEIVKSHIFKDKEYYIEHFFKKGFRIKFEEAVHYYSCEISW